MSESTHSQSKISAMESIDEIAPPMIDEIWKYRTPLVSRYCSAEMSNNFSDGQKFSTWRRLWLWLAKAEKQLGVRISDEQIAEMEANITNIDFQAVQKEEQKRKHDVMAHIVVFSKACPKAAPIIHLGATSAYVGDNGDLMAIRDGFNILLEKVTVFGTLSIILEVPELVGEVHKYAFICLHGASLPADSWLHPHADLVTDLKSFERVRDSLKFLGAKGTTGTQAAFLQLFNNDHEKVERLDRLVTQMAGFNRCYIISGQTYTRKKDIDIITTLASFGATAHKTYSVQWMERTLDDSSNRRISIPESFLTADIILTTLHSIFDGLVVNPKIIEARLRDELPFMCSENILCAMVSAGKDRQECHEQIRKISQICAIRVKSEGLSNDFLERIKSSPYFECIKNKLDVLVDPRTFIGRAPEQVSKYIEKEVEPVLSAYIGAKDTELGTKLNV